MGSDEGWLRIWIGLFFGLTLLMGVVSFASRGSFPIPGPWVTIIQSLLGVGVLRGAATGLKYIADSKFNSPPGLPPEAAKL